MLIGENNRRITGVYKKRWLLLAATCILTTLNQFLSKSFSTANEILVVYFQVSLVQLDWGCIGLYAGATLVTPVLAYLCYGKLIGFRNMAICGSFCSLLSCSCILLAIGYPFLFPIILGASLLQGVTYCICYSATTFFSVLWFPDNQVSLAIAFNSAAMIAGVIFGSTIPPALLKSPPITLNQENISMLLRNTPTNFTQWHAATNKTLIYIYSVVGVILLLLLLFFYVLAEDKPPKAPTLALAKKRITDAKLKETKSWSSFVGCTKELFFDKTFQFCINIAGVIYSLSLIEMLHLSQLLSHVISGSNMNNFVSLLGGYIVFTFAMSGLVSAFLSARILEYFQRHSLQIITGAGLLFGSCICLLFSYYFTFLAGFFVGNIAWGVAVRISAIPIEDIVTRHTYPKDETVVSVWMSGIGSMLAVLLPEAARLLSIYTVPESVLVFVTVITFLVFLLSFLFKPKNSRGQVDEELINENQNESETSQLINEIN